MVCILQKANIYILIPDEEDSKDRDALRKEKQGEETGEMVLMLGALLCHPGNGSSDFSLHITRWMSNTPLQSQF